LKSVTHEIHCGATGTRLGSNCGGYVLDYSLYSRGICFVLLGNVKMLLLRCRVVLLVLLFLPLLLLSLLLLLLSLLLLLLSLLLLLLLMRLSQGHLRSLMLLLTLLLWLHLMFRSLSPPSGRHGRLHASARRESHLRLRLAPTLLPCPFLLRPATGTAAAL